MPVVTAVPAAVQAVAIVFDHAVLPRTSPTSRGTGREDAAQKLLVDICNMVEGEQQAGCSTAGLAAGCHT
jgi:hypothetical protein